MAMLGITNHSKVPLRLATMLGFAVSFLSLLVAVVYLAFKLLFWDQFSLAWRRWSSVFSFLARSSFSLSEFLASISAPFIPRS